MSVGSPPSKITHATEKPGLAIICNVLTPYRVHLHKEVAAGIPELKLHTLVTHGPADFDWNLELPESIHTQFFGSKDDSPLAGMFRRPLSEWRKGSRMIDYLKQNNIQAVILLGYRHLSYLRIIRYCAASGLPVFVNNDSNIHGDRQISGFKSWAKKRLYAWWLRRVSGVMPMGEFGDQFFTYYGARPERFYRVPYWPDYDAFAEVDPKLLQRFRQKYGLSQARKYLLYSGRLVPQKRVDLLVDAYVSIADKHPNWDLLIVGDGVLRDELQRRVPPKLRERCVWTGFIEGNDLPLAYHASEVLVLPSDREPWAVVIQEAMAAGLAIVASDVVGAAHEMILDGVSGRIFPAGDLGELKRALLQLLDEQALVQFKLQSRAALAQYRERVRPVEEIRRALTDVRVLTQPPVASNRIADFDLANSSE